MRRLGPVRAARPFGRADERGAALVEFVLVLPVFMLLLLGMLTGGLAYSRKLAVSQAVREGARYGATLPIPGTGTATDIDTWLRQVANLTISSGDGDLNTGEPGRTVCVAYISASGSRSLSVPPNLPPSSVVGTNGGRCLVDGRSEPRVQVVAHRSSKLEALLWSRDLDLESQAVSRYEAG